MGFNEKSPLLPVHRVFLYEKYILYSSNLEEKNKDGMSWDRGSSNAASFCSQEYKLRNLRPHLLQQPGCIYIQFTTPLDDMNGSILALGFTEDLAAQENRDLWASGEALFISLRNRQNTPSM